MKKAVPVVYLMLLGLIAFYSYKKATHNWDMLAYMALVVSIDEADTVKIHQKVYQAAKDHIPAEQYDLLVLQSYLYRNKMATDAAAFYSQLPFYIVKPLYVGLAYLFYKTGATLPAATVLPSTLAFILCGLLLFYWLSRYMHILLAASISALAMLCDPILNTARLSTPDCLSAFLLFLAIFWLIERRTITVAFIIFLLSVYARLDNIIAIFIIITLLTFTNKLPRRITIKQYAIMMLVLTGVFFSITFWAYRMGWDLLYYTSYESHHLNNVYFGQEHNFSLKEFLYIRYANLMISIKSYNLVTFLLFGIMVYLPQKFTRSTLLSSLDNLIMTGFILIVFTRLLFHPDMGDRFYAGYYLVIIVLLARRVAGAINDRNEQQVSAN